MCISASRISEDGDDNHQDCIHNGTTYSTCRTGWRQSFPFCGRHTSTTTNQQEDKQNIKKQEISYVNHSFIEDNHCEPSTSHEVEPAQSVYSANDCKKNLYSSDMCKVLSHEHKEQQQQELQNSHSTVNHEHGNREDRNDKHLKHTVDDKWERNTNRGEGIATISESCRISHNNGVHDDSDETRNTHF